MADRPFERVGVATSRPPVGHAPAAQFHVTRPGLTRAWVLQENASQWVRDNASPRSGLQGTSGGRRRCCWDGEPAGRDDSSVIPWKIQSQEEASRAAGVGGGEEGSAESQAPRGGDVRDPADSLSGA